MVRRPDGNLIVAGRDKDMINRGGEKISAEEIENFSYQVDGVEMAAAIAMPDPVLGERLCLYVTVTQGHSVSLDDVIAVMNSAGVARFKMPERLVLVDTMPTTKVGKIDKKALREDIRARLGGAT
ncbi:AMP-binding enzyme [Nocardia sp. CA-084685]|uniref:AMP-binding enzyme n=1 Tax=Nocardia sp. CA-084685 TaxID=3239970 RepID=UPI003D9797D0